VYVSGITTGFATSLRQGVVSAEIVLRGGRLHVTAATLDSSSLASDQPLLFGGTTHRAEVTSLPPPRD
jgi:hypothetical protein